MNEVRICLPTKLTVNERISVFKVTLDEYLRDRSYTICIALHRDYCMQRKFEKHYSSARLFGISLELLTDDLQPMPVTVERCIKDVELRGLEVPGIYRKSPNMESITALCNALEQEIDCANKRTMTLNSLIESLPKANLCILDRMIVHLARIAICEKNFMTTSSLAIIFAPNLLRSKNSDKEDEFRDISKKTIILETLLSDCEVKLKTEYGC
ncbi:uncharacterized protein TRIADDRAFT_59665 [Trichoplax adhaerens]|uniref:Rho-GAP domain-containing protein n=1 Tax=Trichoplax adhaerens TaxID=10228 RepID=B3S639_TRIAD|nr:hypothetical protein TRIADDRAFT_59665 [Trichoplax adhaerens]EDV21553.1 hypothetical protein TRIADDRAFT_59665 [Trichoplax adhaerens]|eukprot:XP_002115701.1 hypothetical protein TRIADDRAFT_59665 [Trichoplax adhaerens]